MPKEELSRLDTDQEVYDKILPLCRLSAGEVWEDPHGTHRVGLLDATNPEHMELLYRGEKARAGVHDPPYNIELGQKVSKALPYTSIENYVEFSRKWISSALSALDRDAHFYLWTGADQKRGFQPLPELMILLRDYSELNSRSFITLRNQRGYGTQKNWMAARQELLYYSKGNPPFFVKYTDIPKVLKGYYKTVGGKKTENTERSRSETIRPGNVWIDIQQVFYLMEENVPGSFAQKPLKAVERIIESSTEEEDLVADHFAHSGTSLIAAEKLGRRCFTCDNDPVFAEISIRRLERFRKHGKTGWQWFSPFPEITGTEEKSVGKRNDKQGELFAQSGELFSSSSS
ncbi:MAG: site-specific DNA-methyltransferase [Spirochaetia bacterium]